MTKTTETPDQATAPQPFNLSAEMLMRAQHITTDISRIYLQGALIEPIENNGALIISTNGRLLLVQHDQEAIAPKKIVLKIHPDLSDFDEPCDLCGASHPDANDFSGLRVIIPQTVTHHPQAAPLHYKSKSGLNPAPASHALAQTIPVADKYPDWRKVIGMEVYHQGPTKRKRTGDYTLDPRAMEELAPWARGFKLHNLGHPKAAPIVTFEDSPNTFGIIMWRTPDYQHAKPLSSMLSLIGRADLTPKGE